MNKTLRSATGGLLALLLVPFIVGLLACMPVPIGDPERSRVDPKISGIWVAEKEDKGAAYYAFEPFDKRTWLLTGVRTEENEGKVVLYKVWLTRLGGEQFMVWEPKAVYDNDTFTPEVWFVFRMERPNADTLDLHLVIGDDETFKGVEETRRAYERVLKKNVRNKQIYDDDPLRMTRMNPEDQSVFEALAEATVAFDF